MLRRRFIENLKHQQWMDVLIELIIVVLGVFIGLQASNWNQDRLSDAQAATFAERLKAELRDEDWGYQLQIIYSRQVLMSADRAASALEGKATLSDEALLINAYRATQYKQRARRRSTYDELISTGTIGLIRDRQLRETALRLYNIPTLENIAREGMQSRYREAFRMSLPNDVQRSLAKNCGDRYVADGDYTTLPEILDYPCSTELPEEAVREAAQTLRSSPTLLPLLRLRIADIETRLNDLTSNNREILNRLRAIAAAKP